MPELPEVETIRSEMEPVTVGRVIENVVVNRKDLRVRVPENFSEIVAGQRISSLIRRGKYLVALFDDSKDVQYVMVMHLGMSGRIRIYSALGKSLYEPRKHDHIVFNMEDGSCIAYEDPRRFGMVTLMSRDEWQNTAPFNSMGPEPLAGWSGEALFARLRGKKAVIKTALLDQGVVAGLGNIYVCEALYMSGINPERQACSIDVDEAERLVSCIKGVLLKAIKAGGSTLKDYQKTDGSLGYFQHQFLVYDREGNACRNAGCGGSIIRISQAGRSTFYCPECQK